MLAVVTRVTLHMDERSFMTGGRHAARAEAPLIFLKPHADPS